MSLLCSPTLVFCSSGSSDSLETSASLFLSSRKPSKPHPTTTHPRLPPRQPVLHALSTVGRPSRMTRRFRRSRGWCNLPLGMDRVETLTSLGVLVSRARSQGGGDLDRSIGVMEDALALTPVGHAARSQVLGCRALCGLDIDRDRDKAERAQIRHLLANPTSMSAGQVALNRRSPLCELCT